MTSKPSKNTSPAASRNCAGTTEARSRINPGPTSAYANQQPPRAGSRGARDAASSGGSSGARGCMSGDASVPSPASVSAEESDAQVAGAVPTTGLAGAHEKTSDNHKTGR